MAKDWRNIHHHLRSLEQDARQPRLAMEADEPADTKTCERTKGAATAVQAMHRNSCSATRVDPDPMCSTSFGDDCTGPPAPSCSGEDALVDNGTNSMFVRLGTDYEIRNGGYFESIKNSANQFISKP